jgi:hypothetical protein
MFPVCCIDQFTAIEVSGSGYVVLEELNMWVNHFHRFSPPFLLILFDLQLSSFYCVTILPGLDGWFGDTYDTVIIRSRILGRCLWIPSPQALYLHAQILIRRTVIIAACRSALARSPGAVLRMSSFQKFFFFRGIRGITCYAWVRAGAKIRGWAIWHTGKIVHVNARVVKAWIVISMDANSSVMPLPSIDGPGTRVKINVCMGRGIFAG